MVASLQDSSLEEEHFTQAIADHRNTAAALPLSHEAAMKWFYKDPQGEIQGECCRRWAGAAGSSPTPPVLTPPSGSPRQALSLPRRWPSGSRLATSPCPCW